MILSSEYKRQAHGGPRWITQNPGLLVVGLNALKKEWRSILECVSDNKTIAVASSCRKVGELSGAILPKSFLRQYDHHMPDFADKVTDVPESLFNQDSAS